MVKVNVKWGKQSFEVDVDVSAPAEAFKVQLQSLTNVPADKQKIMGVKGGQLKDGANMAELGLKEGQMLMLIGSAAETVVTAPEAPVVFAEDQKGTSAESATSNGLVNLANTCYLNSALQILRTVPQIRPVLAKGGSPLNAAVSRLFTELDGTRQAVKPVSVWTSLMTQFPEFARTSEHGMPMQHDSQEALAGILNNIIHTIHSNDEFSSLANIVSGNMIQERSKVGDESSAPARSTTDFSILTINLTPGLTTLEMNMESSFRGTMAVPGGEGANEIVYATQSKFSKLPEYMFLHLARFTWRNDTKSKTKVLAQINLPFILDVNNMCTDELKASMEAERATLKERRDKEVERRKRLKQRSGHEEDDDNAAYVDTAPAVLGNTNGFYELCGVISHKGRDADGGHYVAWAKKKDLWLVFDDANVATVTEQNISDLSGGPPEAHMAYILMYRSRDPNTNAPPLQL